MKIDLNENNIKYTIHLNKERGLMNVSFNINVFGEEFQDQVEDTIGGILGAFDNYVDMVRENINDAILGFKNEH